jgi:hypothetical protein
MYFGATENRISTPGWLGELLFTSVESALNISLEFQPGFELGIAVPLHFRLSQIGRPIIEVKGYESRIWVDRLGFHVIMRSSF